MAQIDGPNQLLNFTPQHPRMFGACVFFISCECHSSVDYLSNFLATELINYIVLMREP